MIACFVSLMLPSADLILGQSRSITDRSIDWPTWDQWQRVLMMEDYNTRVVVLGTAVLGCAAGAVGCFTLLRKRALMGDAISHATLPGIALAFIIASHIGWDAKSLPLLLVGATVTGLLGVGVILTLRNLTRLKEDTALGVVLSVFFGAGVAMLGVIQQMPAGHQAGLESFIFGKTASMGAADARLIAIAALLCLAACSLLFKELKLLCFDENFAGSRGFPVVLLDLALMSTVVIISIVGLQAVGLILVVALLIIPAAAARFWTEKLWQMLLLAAFLGTVSGMFGAAASALFPNLPSGAMIVLTCAGFFVFSLVFGRARGVLVRSLRRNRVNQSIAIQHLLRAMYELLERSPADVESPAVTFEELLPMRSWSRGRLQKAILQAQYAEMVVKIGDELRLTKEGQVEAERLTREHRLWELYLITHADVAPSRVDREADRIEHVLEPEMVAELEAILTGESRSLPESPHVRLTPRRRPGSGQWGRGQWGSESRRGIEMILSLQTIGLQWSWGLDGWIVAVAIMCAVACSLLGNFLVLRRMSMLGDAITHAVLPGLAIAFFISNSRSSLPMFVGAVIVGILTAFFTEWIRKIGRVDEGASMGVVFTSLFAAGLVMIVQAADQVDLDASCVLYGAIEMTPLDLVEVMGYEVPRAFLVLSGVGLINFLFVTLFFKELKLTSFDSALATTSGFNASVIHYSLMVLVAVTAVASFESVGSVLVVAMLIVPPATAYMLTDRLVVMIVVSVVVAIAAAVLGHLSALAVPNWFGYQSTTTAGMMAVAAGALLLAATLIGPRHGILVKFARQQLLSLRILADDVVAVLYRIGEQQEQPSSNLLDLRELLFCGRLSLRSVVAWLDRRGDVTQVGDLIMLTPQGLERAQNLVRSHRLWEQYLQDEAGVDASRVHPQAEKLEHFTDERLRHRLDTETDAPQVDPHGSPIPHEPTPP